ncbi:hypothetical protein J2Z60_001662 [Lactobacillus colini]|uniref:Uncharacterized protein n=1 Tax=Lactobacillus colini TaxID=1819254 RepID=A0ABS4MFK6_9LACO|nr:hypothetical protein [Lactobacillus colini]MBP2058477.1 hypothetical protein [Lactobacillus colini]
MAEIWDFLVGKMSQQPGKFIIGLNERMTEYLNTQEWRDYMNDFQRYKEELSREKFN